MRKTQGLPEVVMRAADDVSTSSGTLYSISFGMIARVKVLDQAPISTGTLSLSTSFSTEATASRGLDLLSSRMSWIGRPAGLPPRAPALWAAGDQEMCVQPPISGAKAGLRPWHAACVVRLGARRPPMSDQHKPYDLLLRGGRVIDPAQGLDGILDVAVRGGRIAAVGKNLPGPAKETIDVRGKLVLPGLIDTHAHVYRYVSGRFGLDADTVGVHSGVTTVVDQGGPSVLTFPGFREYIAKPASTRVLAFISAYMVGGLEGHYYPELYRPDCIAVDDTVRAARDNADLVRGVKGHAEIGGFTRWGDEAMRRAAEIGRALDLPLYIHFGQLWPLPDDKHPYDADAILPRHAEDPAAGRYPGPSLHPPSRRLRRPARQGPSGGARGAGARAEDRRRPWLAFLLQDGAAGARGRRRARHAGRRHARLQHHDPQAARHAGDASRQGGDAPLRRRAELLARLGHDQHAGAGPLARAGRADGDQQLRRHAAA